MTKNLQPVREYELTYYDQMPDEVRSLAELRNIGIERVRTATSDEEQGQGINMLAESADKLQFARGKYSREYFASLYMHARGELITGDHRYAGCIAERAMSVVPEIPFMFSETLIADQYVAIASGRLSLMLSASIDYSAHSSTPEQWNITSSKLAKQAARLAVKTSLFSENPELMLFADDTMDAEVRKLARRRHELTALAAVAGQWLPGQNRRVALARKFCA